MKWRSACFDWSTSVEVKHFLGKIRAQIPEETVVNTGPANLLRVYLSQDESLFFCKAAENFPIGINGKAVTELVPAVALARGVDRHDVGHVLGGHAD